MNKLDSPPSEPGRSIVRFLMLLALISFPLHFAWEWVQCQPYFIHLAAPPNLRSMVLATLGDVVLTWLVYAVLAPFHGRAWPMAPWGWSIWLSVMAMALGISVAVELFALWTGRWSYTEAAPLLPGSPLSMLPIAQMLILVPIAMRMTRRIYPRFARIMRWW